MVGFLITVWALLDSFQVLNCTVRKTVRQLETLTKSSNAKCQFKQNTHLHGNGSRNHKSLYCCTKVFCNRRGSSASYKKCGQCNRVLTAVSGGCDVSCRFYSRRVTIRDGSRGKFSVEGKRNIVGRQLLRKRTLSVLGYRMWLRDIRNMNTSVIKYTVMGKKYGVAKRRPKIELNFAWRHLWSQWSINTVSNVYHSNHEINNENYFSCLSK
jgi:hypothetical protein